MECREWGIPVKERSTAVTLSACPSIEGTGTGKPASGATPETRGPSDRRSSSEIPGDEPGRREAMLVKILRLLALLLALAVFASGLVLSMAGADEEPDDPKAVPEITKMLPSGE
jgi:hypothetical protein